MKTSKFNLKTPNALIILKYLSIFLVFYLILLCAVTFINAEKNSRLNRSRGKPGKRGRITPMPCTFEKKSSTKKDSTGKKQRQSETCRPFWIIRRPMCRTGHNKRDICNKKFCWKVVDQKARTENPLIPKGKNFRLKKI